MMILPQIFTYLHLQTVSSKVASVLKKMKIINQLSNFSIICYVSCVGCIIIVDLYDQQLPQQPDMSSDCGATLCFHFEVASRATAIDVISATEEV